MIKRMPDKKSVELLAPAGSMEALQSAFYFGADAVYMAGTQYGLRAFAKNFSTDEMAIAIEIAKKNKKKIYLTINAFFRNDDFKNLDAYVKWAVQTGVDAMIVSDPGVLYAIREQLPDNIELHLSTQANTTNYKAALFWHKAGIKRIILARECSLEDIRKIRENTPDTLDLEVFVHGAMCISYSGRCLLSSMFTGRNANAGECVQPCRWEYYVSEKKMDGAFHPVMEDEKGTYIFNSKDLMLIEHLGKLFDAGVSSFKIEGRMKSAYYVASVVHAYRMAVDDLLSGKHFNERLADELRKSATREFTTGFLFGTPGKEAQDIKNNKNSISKYAFVAKVLDYDTERELYKIEQRNRFFKGDILEVLSPLQSGSFEVISIIDENGNGRESAPHPQEILYIQCGLSLHEGDMLRKKL
jgi:putative protease